MALGKVGTSILAGTVLASGVVIGAVSFDKSAELNDITTMANDMAEKVVNLDASKDNYKQALEDLQADANKIIDEANTTISEKNTVIGKLKKKASDLQDSLD